MLLLDGEQWTFEAWKKALPKNFKEKSVGDFTNKSSNFRLADKLFVKYAEKNKRAQRASGFGIEPSFSFYGSDGESHEVRYYTTKKPTTRRGIELIEYEPALITIEDGILQTDVAQLAWYLFHYPQQASSPFKHKKKGLWWFKDEKEIARAKKEKANHAATVYVQLMDTQKGLVEDQLRQLAHVYGLKNPEEGDLEVIRMELLDKAINKTKGNPNPEEKFLDSIESPTMAMTVEIRKAVAAKVITFEKSKGTWYFVNQETKKPDYGMKIKTCLKKDRADQELSDYLANTNEGGNILKVIESYMNQSA